MKHLALLATVAMITVKMCFAHLHSSSCQGHIFLHQIMQPIGRKCNLNNGVKQIKIIEENLSLICILCQLLRTKTCIMVKMHQTFFFVFITICLISTEWM